jgi:cytochrome c oxidase subunit II
VTPLLFTALAAQAQAQELVRPDREGSFWLPPAASTLASEIDAIWDYIYYVDLFFFVVMVVAIVYLFVRYKQKHEGEPTADIKGNHTLEIAWSVGPTFLLVAMFWMGFKTYMNSAVPPADAYEVKVTGQKWFWTFTYTTPDGKTFDSDKLIAPKGQPVKLLMSSKDVLHSFFVPDFRIKKDVLPNRYTVLWFEAPWEGEHQIYCTEYCGDNHSRMLSTVEVLDPQDFNVWIREKSAAGPVTDGPTLFATKGCAVCHSIDGSTLVGPTLKGKFGTQEKLADGSSVTVDENYLRESIVAPAAKVVAGFSPVMPPYAGQLTDEQIDGLIAYIKTLN